MINYVLCICPCHDLCLLIKLNSLQKESLKSIEPLLNDHDGSTQKSNGWLFHHYQKRDINKTNDTKCKTIKTDPQNFEQPSFLSYSMNQNVKSQNFECSSLLSY
jgi:hypothetical protein